MHKRSKTRGEQAARAITGELEAASTLLKFASDDLEELAAKAKPELRGCLLKMATELQKMAGQIFAKALFVDRIDHEDLAREAWPATADATVAQPRQAW